MERSASIHPPRPTAGRNSEGVEGEPACAPLHRIAQPLNTVELFACAVGVTTKSFTQTCAGNVVT